MIKQGGQWLTVDWQTALEYVAAGVKGVLASDGARAVGALLSPHSTLEELHLATRLMRSLGSDNIDHRLRHAEFATAPGARHLGMPIAALGSLDRALVIGSNLRKDHPLFAQRIRQAVRGGCQLSALVDQAPAWAMAVAHADVAAPSEWVAHLANVAYALAQEKGIANPFGGAPDMQAKAIAQLLPHRMRLARTPIGAIVEWKSPGNVSYQPLAVGAVGVAREAVQDGRRASPVGVLPLRFRGQAHAGLRQEALNRVPTHRFHRSVGDVDDWYLCTRALEGARVRTHPRRPLRLSHFIPAHVERVGQRHRVNRTLV
jgi:NADH dehydrogenase/NADH:ubiquinone oxidoreductase subunit G